MCACWYVHVGVCRLVCACNCGRVYACVAAGAGESVCVGGCGVVCATWCVGVGLCGDGAVVVWLWCVRRCVVLVVVVVGWWLWSEVRVVVSMVV